MARRRLGLDFRSGLGGEQLRRLLAHSHPNAEAFGVAFRHEVMRAKPRHEPRPLAGSGFQRTRVNADRFV